MESEKYMINWQFSTIIIIIDWFWAEKYQGDSSYI